MSFNEPFMGDTNNPYSYDSTSAQAVSFDKGMLGQVPAVGILIILQGVLIIVAGGLLAGFGLLMPQFFRQMQNNPNMGGNPPPMPPNFEFIMAVVYGSLGLVLVVVGILTVIAGVRVYRLRGRIFAIVMVCVGLGTCITCYCAPTAIGIAIYAMIVLFNEPVKRAFQMVANGASALLVQQTFPNVPQ